MCGFIRAMADMLEIEGMTIKMQQQVLWQHCDWQGEANQLQRVVCSSSAARNAIVAAVQGEDQVEVSTARWRLGDQDWRFLQPAERVQQGLFVWQVDRVYPEFGECTILDVLQRMHDLMWRSVAPWNDYRQRLLAWQQALDVPGAFLASPMGAWRLSDWEVGESAIAAVMQPRWLVLNVHTIPAILQKTVTFLQNKTPTVIWHLVDAEESHPS